MLIDSIFFENTIFEEPSSTLNFCYCYLSLVWSCSFKWCWSGGDYFLGRSLQPIIRRIHHRIVLFLLLLFFFILLLPIQEGVVFLLDFENWITCSLIHSPIRVCSWKVSDAHLFNNFAVIKLKWLASFKCSVYSEC